MYIAPHHKTSLNCLLMESHEAKTKLGSEFKVSLSY